MKEAVAKIITTIIGIYIAWVYPEKMPIKTKWRKRCLKK